MGDFYTVADWEARLERRRNKHKFIPPMSQVKNRRRSVPVKPQRCEDCPFYKEASERLKKKGMAQILSKKLSQWCPDDR